AAGLRGVRRAHGSRQGRPVSRWRDRPQRQDRRLWDVSNQPRRIGERLFTDGITRPVFEDADGRQFVDDDGQRVYGVWLVPADEPAIVDAPAGSAWRQAGPS